MRILIVGAGIAGLSAALQLGRAGHAVHVLERHARVRDGGYMIDFFGPGFDAADKMGLLPALEAIHYAIPHLRFVDARGRARADLAYTTLRAKLFGGWHFNFMRGELEVVLYEHAKEAARFRFGASPTEIVQRGAEVVVAATDGGRDAFDLVLGADGVHSAVRGLVLAPGEARLVSLGAHTAAYVASRRPPGLSNDAFESMSVAGKTIAAYPIRGGRTATFLVHRAAAPIGDRSPSACRAELERTFRGAGWIADELLDVFPADGAGVYFDDVVQVVASRWSAGRVALLGDAAGCVSLVAGQGASMAVAGAYVLARELDAHGDDVAAALAAYEARVRPAVEKRQRAGRRNASVFLPRSDAGAWLRDRTFDVAMRSPLAGLFGRTLGDAPLVLD
ncbi:MAG TPA: FAD-dependent oxidoreductase [Minicystis sp.]|nr:FAD-dependent oxidoreductase [Minicystis sp.]